MHGCGSDYRHAFQCYRWARCIIAGMGREEGTGVYIAPDLRPSVGKQHQGWALTGCRLRCQATPPVRRSEPEWQGGWSRRGERQNLAAALIGARHRQKTRHGGLWECFCARAPSDPATVTYPPSFDTYYRSAYLILKSVPHASAEAHTGNKDAWWTRDRREEGTGVGQTVRLVPEYHH
jgi:hypothetical protein